MLLIGNTSDLCAIRKGRLSSKILNTVCRRLAASLIRSNITLDPHWVPSELNPDDGPYISTHRHYDRNPHLQATGGEGKPTQLFETRQRTAKHIK